MIARTLIIVALLCSTTLAGHRMVVQQQQVQAWAVVVTPYAVPVLTPQYVAPVAAISYVQYGMPYSTSTTTSMLDQVAKAAADAAVAKYRNELKSAGLLPADVVPTLTQKYCASCHGGAQPKGDLDLTNLAIIDPIYRLQQMQRRVLSDDTNEQMPPAGATPIGPEDLGQLLQEWATVPYAPGNQRAKDQPPPAPKPAPAK